MPAGASGGCPHRRPFIAPCWSFQPRVQDRPHVWKTRSTGGRRLGRLHRQRTCSRRPQPSVKRLGSKDAEPQKPQSHSRAKAAGGRYRTPADVRSDGGSCKAKSWREQDVSGRWRANPPAIAPRDARTMPVLVAPGVRCITCGNVAILYLFGWVRRDAASGIVGAFGTSSVSPALWRSGACFDGLVGVRAGRGCVYRPCGEMEIRGLV